MPLTKKEVVVGGCYSAKLGPNLTIVQITSKIDRMTGYPKTRTHTAWIAKNLMSGRTVTIRSAAKLRRKATPEEVASYIPK